MAEATYLHIHEPDDDPLHPDQSLTLDSIPYYDFDLYSSDPEFPPSDPSVQAHISFHEDDFFSQHESTIHVRSLDDGVSEPCSIANADLLDRENQVNFVMDLFQQRVEQSHVMGRSDLVCEALNDSNYGVIEGNCDVDMDGLDLDLGLGLGLDFGVDRHCLDDDDEDDFFVSRRVSGSDSGEGPSSTSRVEPFTNCVRLVGFGSDSDEEENGVIGIDLHSEDEYGIDHLHEDNDDDTSIPLCWDSLQLEDHRETNEDFEWEEVDGRVDERDVLSMFIEADNEGSVSVSVAHVTGPEEEVNVERVGGLGNLEWEVLLHANNLDTNPEVDHDYETYLNFGDHDDYIYAADYGMLFSQFAETENAFMGRPPASKTVVENLPSVVLTQENIENNDAICAVCKDDINIDELAKQLPCSHRYHGDCIVPWLGIRNTCPVCRYELPTDDADYERRRTERAGRGL
ncbi:hypothetical protein FNV43_RR20749 [Rhamnella rubrinervis]|uniref:RING-type E3 ubiquitin transferase n=1 Tax=Rhamnella rubrinervis TaxID=2594499 RepID=A0A8K0DZC7_9ROSA|nr:hypothetical protein FNV43_RR20749 [Rhamnella rubrinervis]